MHHGSLVHRWISVQFSANTCIICSAAVLGFFTNQERFELSSVSSVCIICSINSIEIRIIH